MKSEVREKLQKRFMDIEIDTKFQLVNSVMGAAMFTGDVFKKVTSIDAERERDNENVNPRLDSLVEIVP